MLQALRDPLRVFTDYAVQPVAYIVFMDGVRYYAKNGSTGLIEYSDVDAFKVIQYVVDRAPMGSTIYIKAGVYRLSDTIIISRPITVIGEGGYIEPSYPTVYDGFPSSLIGTVLVQTKAGADVIKITVSGAPVNLKGLVLTWDDPIKNANTGNGITGIPPAVEDGYNHGVMHGVWERIYIIGHDGDHYGVHLINFAHMVFINIRAIGGGGLRLTNYPPSARPYHYGNSVIIEFFNAIMNPGTAHGIFLEGVREYMNLVHFVRPQVNIGVTSGPSRKHITYLWNVRWCTFEAIDMEGTGYTGGIDVPPESLITEQFTYQVPGWARRILQLYDVRVYRHPVGIAFSSDILAPGKGIAADWHISYKGITYLSKSISPPSASGVESVPGGATSVTITFADRGTAEYMVLVETNWPTRYYITGKTRSQCVINFDTPAPAGGGTVRWIVINQA
jgi:hypothetical protein